MSYDRYIREIGGLPRHDTSVMHYHKGELYAIPNP
jgi:hypothetical protein